MLPGGLRPALHAAPADPDFQFVTQSASPLFHAIGGWPPRQSQNRLGPLDFLRPASLPSRRAEGPMGAAQAPTVVLRLPAKAAPGLAQQIPLKPQPRLWRLPSCREQHLLSNPGVPQDPRAWMQHPVHSSRRLPDHEAALTLLCQSQKLPCVPARHGYSEPRRSCRNLETRLSPASDDLPLPPHALRPARGNLTSLRREVLWAAARRSLSRCRRPGRSADSPSRPVRSSALFHVVPLLATHRRRSLPASPRFLQKCHDREIRPE